jgi:hypothetical protein
MAGRELPANNEGGEMSEVNTFWMVYIDGTMGCTHKHLKYSEAKNEAARLALLPTNRGCKVFVLRATDYVIVETPAQWYRMDDALNELSVDKLPFQKGVNMKADLIEKILDSLTCGKDISAYKCLQKDLMKLSKHTLAVLLTTLPKINKKSKEAAKLYVDWNIKNINGDEFALGIGKLFVYEIEQEWKHYLLKNKINREIWLERP